MSFPDTGPQEDGTRTAEQWFNAMGEDVAMIRMQLRESLTEEDREVKARSVAIARKEARRLESDIMRFAAEIHGLGRDEIDAIGPL